MVKLRQMLCAGLLGAVSLAAATEVQDWLRRLHDAARSVSYRGTLVISVDEQMAAAQVHHSVAQGVVWDQIEVLTGEPRTTYRRDQTVVTVWPRQRLWVQEQRHDLSGFTAPPAAAVASLAQHYRLHQRAADRVAGRGAQVVEIAPQDAARWGYRIWRDADSGVMLKLQTLAPGMDRVIEQSAFSDIRLPVPPLGLDWAQALAVPEGFQQKIVQTRVVDPLAFGLHLPPPVAGFVLLRAQLPQARTRPDEQHPLQWVFSDGLASVSVFYQPLAKGQTRDRSERALRMGATHTLVHERPQLRLTVVGEAPLATLRAFAQALRVSSEQALNFLPPSASEGQPQGGGN